jgi:hypothetical protein
MTLNISRRDMLKAAAFGIVTTQTTLDVFDPAPELESELIAADFDFNPSGTPRELARFIAAWELQSVQSTHASCWREISYRAATQWSDGRDGKHPLAVFYGVGRAESNAYCAKNWPEHMRRNWPECVLAAELVARGRAFAVVIKCKLDEDARELLRPPAFDSSGERVVRDAPLPRRAEGRGCRREET